MGWRIEQRVAWQRQSGIASFDFSRRNRDFVRRKSLYGEHRRNDIETHKIFFEYFRFKRLREITQNDKEHPNDTTSTVKCSKIIQLRRGLQKPPNLGVGKADPERPTKPETFFFIPHSLKMPTPPSGFELWDVQALIQIDTDVSLLSRPAGGRGGGDCIWVGLGAV